MVPMGADDPPLHAPEPLDPMAEPGIIAAEAHWLSIMDVPHPGAVAVGEVTRGPEGDVGHADPLAPGAEAGDSDDEGEVEGGGDDHDVSDPGITLAARPPRLTFAAAGTGAPVPPADAYSLRLVASHHLWDAGVGVAHSPHLAPLASEPRLRANPQDLERLGHKSGSRVKAVASRGSLVLPVDADPGLPRGSVALGFNLPGTGPLGAGGHGEGAADLIDATAAVTNVRLDSI